MTVGRFSENSEFPASQWRVMLVLLLAGLLSACSSLGASGPSTSAVKGMNGQSYGQSDIQVIDLDDSSVRRIVDYGESRSFAKLFLNSGRVDTVIGRGDVVDIAVWEAPPAVLFGVTSGDSRLATSPLVAQSAAIPQQMVGDDGNISVPFVGSVTAAGRTPAQVQRDIVGRLMGKAHDPQVVVRLVQNEARNVTILGEVAGNRRVPLSARGERLLDVLAAAGGPRQPVGKTTIQLSRGTTAVSMPLEAVIRDPAQNVRVMPDDVITVLFQPYSFIALGAVSQNAEVPFEGSDFTLAKALGRIGGLRDERADIRGVFVFRMEDPAALDSATAAAARTTIDGRIPVVYRLNLSNASSLFTARDFAIRDDDILYVSNAPAADLQKFLTTLSSVAFSTIAISDSLTK
jgi:polysaccharide export outer membrane protein